MHKYLALSLLLLYFIFLTAISLINLGRLPSLGSSFDDKIFHFLSHVLFTFLAFNYFTKIKVSKPILISALLPISYGIIIEWLQGILTNSRTTDVYDVFANILGTVFAVIILSTLKNVKLK